MRLIGGSDSRLELFGAIEGTRLHPHRTTAIIQFGRLYSR